MYCSAKCRSLASWRRRNIPRKTIQTKNCDQCGKAFETNRTNQRFCSYECRYDNRLGVMAKQWAENNPRPEVFVYDCDWCGLKIERDKPLGGIKRYHKGDCSKQAQDARYRAKTVKRQQAGVKPSRIVVEQLVAIHGAVCYLCTEPIDMTIPRTSPMGATVEHIVPLSRQGTDDFENLQLAHWICNIRKSNKLIEGINA